MSDLEKVDIGKRATQKEVNSLIASKHLQKVLAVCVVIFGLILQLAIQVDGTLQEKDKYIWLAFQLSDEPAADLSGDSHPFVRIIRCSHCASNEVLDILIELLSDIRHEYLPQLRFIFWARQSTAVLQIVSPFFHIIHQPGRVPVDYPRSS